MRSKLPLVLLVLVLLVAPAAATITPIGAQLPDAQFVTADGSTVIFDLADLAPGHAMTTLTIRGIHVGESAQISLYQGDRLACTGIASYQAAGLCGMTHGNISLALGNSLVSWEELAPGGSWRSLILVIRYAMDRSESGDLVSTGLLLSNHPPGGQSQDQYAYQAVAGILNSPITRVEVVSSDGTELTVTINHSDAGLLKPALTEHSEAKPENFIGKLSSFVFSVLNIIMVGIVVFKFVFIDHFFEVVVFYESIALAYAASQSRSLIVFFQKFAHYNERLIYFLMRVVQFVVDFFYKIIQSLKPT